MSTPMASVLRLEVDAGDAINKIHNSSGVAGTSGWTGYQGTLSAVTGVEGHYYGYAFKIAPAFSGSTYFSGMRPAELMPVTPGEWMNMQVNLSNANAGNRVTLAFEFLIPGSPSLTFDAVKNNAPAAEAVYKFTGPVQVPPGATQARISIAVIGPNAGDVLVSRIMIVGDPNKAFVTDVPYADGPAWQNILGSAYSISCKRGNEIDGVTDKPVIGTLHATLSDPLVDPTNNPRMRPGKRITVMYDHGEGFNTIWSGKIATLDVTYKGKKPRITLTAVDAWSEVMNIQAPEGYGGTLKQRIDKILQGKVAYSVGGPTEAAEVSNVIDVQPSATAIDQIEWATIAKNGFAFADAQGRIEAWKYQNWNVSRTYTSIFSDNLADAGPATTFYTDIDVNFGSQSLTNSLMVRRHNLDEADGEKTYGPYTNAASAAAWGTKTATLDVNDGNPAGLAAYYLKTYANPETFASSLKFDGRRVAHPIPLYGLYYRARVKHAASGLDATYRIINIEHDITPQSWKVTLGFKPLEATASVVVTDPPGGPNSGPGDLVQPDPGPLSKRARSTTFNVASATATTVPYNVAVNSDGIEWDTANNRWTVPKDGRYGVKALVTFAANGTGARLVRIFINGVSAVAGRWPAHASAPMSFQLAEDFALLAGDVVSIVVEQTSGGALSLDPSAATNRASITYIGP